MSSARHSSYGGGNTLSNSIFALYSKPNRTQSEARFDASLQRAAHVYISCQWLPSWVSLGSCCGTSANVGRATHKPL